MTGSLGSIDRVVDVIHVRGAQASVDAPADLLLEIPHGATRAHHFTSLRAQLKGPFPDNLIDFFFVNTDVGAPEGALALAHHVVARAPTRSVALLRCQIPRTFIDCNRVIDEASRPGTSSAGGMTPGVVRYVTDADDLKLLFSRYRAYRASVEAHMERVCGSGGTALMFHSYAPRSVDVEVDENIVARLHEAYRPEVEPTWPLRAEVDLISKSPEGAQLADPELVTRVKDALASGGLAATECGTYALHPVSLAHGFAVRWPTQTLCLEVRRDLLVQKFTPFSEMTADAGKCARIGALLGDALLGWWRARR
jgi:N-formylglutamate amidohydrolase